jgi:MFS family permease
MLVAFFMPLFFQSVQEASPLRSGLLLLPYALADAASGIATGVVISKTGSFIVFVWVGSAMITLSSGLLLIFNASTGIALDIGLMIVAGFAIGILFQPVLLSIHAHTEQDHVAMATAAVGSARTISGAMAVVVGGVVFQHGMAQEAPSLRAAGASDSLIRQFSGIDATANTPLIRTIENRATKAAVKVAYASSIHHIWILCVSVAATAFLASFLVKGKTLSSDHTETKTGLKSEREDSEA